MADATKAIRALERRKALLTVLQKKRMWMSAQALRRYADVKRQVIEQDLSRMAERGLIEVVSAIVWNPELEREQIVKLARMPRRK